MNTNYKTPAAIEEEKLEKIIFSIKLTMYLSGIIFILFGLYTVCFNFQSVSEIKNINNETVMEVYKSSLIPPFKEIDFVINNVKTTELDPAKEKRTLVSYSINVEDFNNNKTTLPITSYSYEKQKDLSEKMNNAIKNNENFKHVDKSSSDKMLGFLFICIGLTDLLISFLIFEKVLKKIIKKNLNSSQIYS